MKTTVVKIKWDIDDISQEELNLPDKIELPEYIDKEEVANWLSNKYGWCIEALSYE